MCVRRGGEYLYANYHVMVHMVTCHAHSTAIDRVCVPKASCRGLNITWMKR